MGWKTTNRGKENMLSPLLSVSQTCDKATKWLEQLLSQNGFRVMQTFDLHEARHGFEDCPCPHHGTDQCDCQMVILLVYGNTSEPVTLILHGYDGQTWISLADRPGLQVDTKTVIAIQRVLASPASSGK